MARPWRISLLFLVLSAACASHRPASLVSAPPEAGNDFGVLLMAHGGSPEWNDGVLATVEPLRGQYTIEVAFGMADAASIQRAIRSLEARGVRKIGVVRLFVSGSSWHDRTEQVLGLRAGAPDPPAGPGRSHEAALGSGNHSMEFWRVQTEASFALSVHGLAEAESMGAVLADRAQALSRHPQRENVLILAHGPGDDSENERWIANLDNRAQSVRDALPFSRVQVMTLREDWPEKREAAERRIRGVVTDARGNGLTTIVIPFRVQGFGPYGQVLEGFDYVYDGQGLIPHVNVTQWVEAEIKVLRRGPFRSPHCSAESPNRPMQRTAGCAGRR